MPGVKICVVSGSRAEFGQLLPLLFKLEKDPFFDLDFVVTGTHLSAEAGDTVSEINEYPIKVNRCIPISSISDNSRKGIAHQISEVISLFADYFELNRPEILLAIGDRYEMYGVALAAATLLIPIVHLCGGSTTSGAIDEVFRHSITKMSSIHFTTCEAYRHRVIQLGENPKNVYNVGSLAIENCLKTVLLSDVELRSQLGIASESRYCVVTFHPVTLEKEGSESELNELIAALDFFPEYSYIITLSNADSGGKAINERWEREGKKRKNFYVVPSLGMKRYLTALKYSEMMIGNSSSGTTEGPAMKIPTIDIGDRQKGRVFAKSVIHCEPRKEGIIEAIKQANSKKFRARLENIQNPFGDGTTSDQMVSILKENLQKSIEVKKDFYDIKFEV